MTSELNPNINHLRFAGTTGDLAACLEEMATKARRQGRTPGWAAGLEDAAQLVHSWDVVFEDDDAVAAGPEGRTVMVGYKVIRAERYTRGRQPRHPYVRLHYLTQGGRQTYISVPEHRIINPAALAGLLVPPSWPPQAGDVWESTETGLRYFGIAINYDDRASAYLLAENGNKLDSAIGASLALRLISRKPDAEDDET